MQPSKSLERLLNEYPVMPSLELELGPTGYRLSNMTQHFGPTRDPKPMGTIAFAMGLRVTLDPDDSVVGDFADAMEAWATLLSRLEQGDLPLLEDEFTSESVTAWADAAMLLCPSVEVAKQVSQTVHWLLDTAAYRAERRARAVVEAKDWLQECLVKAERYLGQTKSLHPLGTPTEAAVVAACLAGYHLLRGASRLYTVPTDEEIRTRELSGEEAPEDVRLGYIELGLTRRHQHFGEKLGAWEYALRYQPQFRGYLPIPLEVDDWARDVHGAYRAQFAAVLD